MTSRTVNSETTTYTYDKASRLKTITHRGQTTSYQYDAASRLTQKTLPNGVTQSMSYDDASRLLNLTYKKSTGEIIEQLTYTYDARGQQLTKTTTNAYPEAAESLYTASHDAANRMTSITTKGTGAPATAGRAATDETFTFTYAPKEVPLGDDANGNMAQKKKADNSDTTTFSRFHVAAILVYAEQEPRRNFLRCPEFSR